MNAEWKPYPQIRPPMSGTYLVTYKTGGVHFRHYNRIDDYHGEFSHYRAEVIAWDFKPRGYKEQNDGRNTEADERNENHA